MLACRKRREHFRGQATRKLHPISESNDKDCNERSNRNSGQSRTMEKVMKRKIASIGALLIIGALPYIVWSQGAVSGATLAVPLHQPKTLRRDEIRIITIADGTRGEKRASNTGSNGPSQGDLFVFDQPLLDQSRGDIGSNSGYCVTTKSGVHSQCQWTLKFDDGSIIVAGQEAESGKSVLAVIGATGKFSGFTGEMSSEPNGDGTFTQELTLFRP
jgi:hypothetical protein